MSMKNFQSTPPRRRRRFHKRDCLGNEIFNPRLREGGDIYLIKNGYSCNLFQSTPPRRRRQKFAVFPVGAGKTFQSTPPRRRRRQFIVYPCKKSIFSIHASAKEATPMCQTLPCGTNYFQSTPPRRRRPLKLIASCASLFSIHASAKEATSGGINGI